MVLPLLILAQFHWILLQTTLPISPIPWFGVSLVAALIVMAVAAALYMIAPILGSSAMRQWSIFQVYEAVLSVALIVLFLGVVQLFFINPQSGFAGVGLVPTGCTATNTIYSLSACDLSQFNSASYAMAGYMWAFAVAKGAIPSSTFSIQPVPQEGDSMEINFGVPNVFDALNTQLINYMMGAILAAVLLSQLQLILLSSSLMLLSLFFTIGLIARVFGISRSFGGAMIAFGIGLGLIYPLLIAITYGYVDVTANTYCIISPRTCFGRVMPATAAFGAAFFALMTSSFGYLTSLGATPATTAIVATGGAAVVSPVQTSGRALVFVFKEIGYMIAGLTIIPIINIIIVDVFIIDFSRAVGEQMSFSMLFQGVI